MTRFYGNTWDFFRALGCVVALSTVFAATTFSLDLSNVANAAHFSGANAGSTSGQSTVSGVIVTFPKCQHNRVELPGAAVLTAVFGVFDCHHTSLTDHRFDDVFVSRSPLQTRSRDPGEGENT